MGADAIVVTVQPPSCETVIEVRREGFASLWAYTPAGGTVLLFCGEGVEHLLPAVTQDAPPEVRVAGPIMLPVGEHAKTAEVLARGWQACADHGVGRADLIVAVGGGSVTDVVGLIAATWMRGVPVVHVPTTVLAMVDGAIGGKTAINAGVGKNMVGAFHAPVAVICSMEALKTLPSRDRWAGMAEVIKAGWIRDASLLEDLERLSPDAPIDHPELVEAMRKAVAVKADLVGQDFHEQGPRMLLNYGHTFGHAVEKASGFGLRHGEAVSIGMMFAAYVGREVGTLSETDVERHRALLMRWHLPTTSSQTWPWPQLWGYMASDKKNRGRGVRLILASGPGQTQVVDGVPEEVMLRAARAVGAVSP